MNLFNNPKKQDGITKISMGPSEPLLSGIVGILWCFFDHVPHLDENVRTFQRIFDRCIIENEKNLTETNDLAKSISISFSSGMMNGPQLKNSNERIANLLGKVKSLVDSEKELEEKRISLLKEESSKLETLKQIKLKEYKTKKEEIEKEYLNQTKLLKKKYGFSNQNNQN
jgi:hypothetical protein